MELNSPWLLTTVGIYILHFDNLRNVFDNLDQSVNLVDLNYVNEFLLEKLSKLHVHFIE